MSANSNDVFYQLPLRRLNRVTQLLGILLGVFAFCCGTALVCTLSLWSFLGFAIAYGGAVLGCLCIHSPTRQVSYKGGSCMVSSMALCLDFVGHPWDVKHLESELNLNIDGRGTRTDHVIRFLVSHSIDHRVLRASNSRRLADSMRANRAPVVAVVEQPILFDPTRWGMVFKPIRSILYWFGIVPRKSDANSEYHAVVIFGVQDNHVLVYDPGTGTNHKLAWSWLVDRLHQTAFVDSPFLMVHQPIRFRPDGRLAQ